MAIHLLDPFSLAIFLLFLFFLFKLLWGHDDRKTLPPSPPRFPIIGHLHQIGKFPHRSLQSLSERYGDLMLLHLGRKRTIVVSSADVAEQALKTHDVSFSDRSGTSFLKRLFYDGKDLVFSPYGEYWRQMRSISVVHLLSNARVQSFDKIRAEEVALMVENIKSLSSSTSFPVINLSKTLMTLTNDVICRVAFGRKYRGDQAGEIDIIESMKQVSYLSKVNSVGDYIPWLSWINRFNGTKAETDKVVKKFDDFMETVLSDHSTHAKEGPEKHKSGEKIAKDLVDVALEMQREHPTSIDKEGIKGIILDMFIAGLDTSSITLEWAMSEIVRHPHVMKELQHEAETTVANRIVVTANDLKHMNYLKAVIKETLRLHPPFPLLIPRESNHDVDINGYRIPKGTQVIVNAWAIGRDSSYWDEPEKFRPERFLNSPVDFKGHDYQLIPFGAGRRGCPGISFANAIIELVLVNLVHQFDWALPNSDDLDMIEHLSLSAKRKNPLTLVATPRV